MNGYLGVAGGILLTRPSIGTGVQNIQVPLSVDVSTGHNAALRSLGSRFLKLVNSK